MVVCSYPRLNAHQTILDLIHRENRDCDDVIRPNRIIGDDLRPGATSPKLC
jgi:hypothetical protein